MRMLDAQLVLLQAQRAQGKDVDDQIAETLIAMLKDAYIRDEITLAHLENVTEAILRGDPVGMLQAGECVIWPQASLPESRRRRPQPPGRGQSVS